MSTPIYIPLRDNCNNPLTGSKVSLRAYSPPYTINNSGITSGTQGAPTIMYSDATGSAYFPSVIPGLYKISWSPANANNPSVGYNNFENTIGYFNITDTSGSLTNAWNFYISPSSSLNPLIPNSISASYALTATSASYAPGSPSISASYAVSASYAPGSPSISSSYATTASFALNGGGTSGPTTQSIFATQSLFATSSLSASITTAPTGTTYAVVLTAGNSGFNPLVTDNTGNLNWTPTIQTLFAPTMSAFLVSGTSLSASKATVGVITASGQSQFNSQVNINAPLRLFNNNGIAIAGVGTLVVGGASALDNGSISTDGNGNMTAVGFSGSLVGTASWASNVLSASYAKTASVLLGSVVSASYALSASYAPGSSSTTASYVTGSNSTIGSLTTSNINPIGVIGIIADSTGVTAIDWQNRRLIDGLAPAFSLDWKNRILYDPNQLLSINYDSRIMYDHSSNPALNWFSRSLIGSWLVDSLSGSFTGPLSGTSSWANNVVSASYAKTASILLGSVISASYAGTASVLLGSIVSSSYALSSSNAISASYAPGSPSVSASYASTASNATSASYVSGSNGTILSLNGRIIHATNGVGQLVDSATLQSLDWQNRNLDDTSGNPSVDWQGRTLNDSADNTVLAWNTELLYDNVGQSSLDWQNRYFITSGGAIVLNYNQSALSGSWIVSGSLSVSQNLTASNISASGVVTVRTPVNPTDAVTKEYVDSISNTFGTTYLFRSSSAAVSNYNNMFDINTPISSSTAVIQSVNPSVNQQIVAFISPNLGVTSIPAGILENYYYAYATGVGVTTSISSSLYLRTGSVEVLIASGMVNALNALSNEVFTDSYILTSSLSVHTTDRLVTKFNVVSATGVPTVNFSVEGATGAGLKIPIVSSNFVLKSGDTMTGGLTASAGVFGTASYATRTLSSSYAGTASILLGSVTSASFATTASYALNANTVNIVTSVSDNPFPIVFTGQGSGPQNLLTDGASNLTWEPNTETLQATYLAISGSPAIGNPSPIIVDNISNNYSEINNQNTSHGANASSDLVATNDSGSATTNYIDLGINGGQYTASFIGQKNDGYLYLTSSTGNLYIGNANPSPTSNTGNIYFFNGGTSNTSSVAITAGGQVSCSAITASNIGYSLAFGSNPNFTITGSQTYYFGAIGQTILPSPTYGNRYGLTIAQPSTLRAISLTTNNNAVDSAANQCTASFRIGAKTLTGSLGPTINFALNTQNQTINTTGINITCSMGDVIAFQILTPLFTSNPSNTNINGTLWFSTP